MAEKARAPLDYAGLAESMVALGYPARLELLDMLRFPHTASELRLTAHRGLVGGNPDRAVARQTLQAHLDKLVETGLVLEERYEEAGRPARRYVVNPQRVYALTEDIRRLTVRQAGRTPGAAATATVAGQAVPALPPGPRLLLVHGLYEGKCFGLGARDRPAGRWLIGRKQGLAVTLDYDPYVSLEHTAVRREGRGFVVEDLGSKNGTHVNWSRVPRGGAAPIRSGDVVGVGRSLLAFAAE